MFRSMKQFSTIARRYTSALNPNKQLDLARQLQAATDYYNQLKRLTLPIPPQGPRDPQDADDLHAHIEAKKTGKKNILSLERELLNQACHDLRRNQTTIPHLQKIIEKSARNHSDTLNKFEYLAAQAILNRHYHTVLVHARGLTAVDVIAAIKANGMRPVIAYQKIDAETPAVLSIDPEDRILIDDYSSVEETKKIVLALKEERGLPIAFHPGIGYRSEDADFAEFCEKNDVLFIGPKADCLRIVADKGAVKKFMQDLGFTVPETYHATSSDTLESITKAVQTIGYPLMIKVTKLGGGGKGNRLVNNDEELANAYHTLSTHGELIVEKYIEDAKHIELQLLINEHVMFYLGARDCSLQKFFQKLLERGVTDPELLKKSHGMGTHIGSALHEMGYRGPGTVEFLVDKNGKFYFMEINPRLQMERFVTQELTQTWIAKMGLDAVIDRLADLSELTNLNDGLKKTSLSSEVYTRHVRLNAHNVGHNDGKLYYEGISGKVTRIVKPDNTADGRIELAIQENTRLGHKEEAIDTQFGYVLTRGKTQKEADEKAIQLVKQIKIEVDGVEQPCNFEFARFCLQYLVDHPEQKELINTGDFLGEQYIAHCEQQATLQAEAKQRPRF
ncbi:MAG TPA: biotin carboxylase N-terminal domain-containing protein [Gammaproteobacteria bacterium]|nr:biotin carboxylase N-terminal domain-containing protein [Gammaproteobacteria bacterium]